MVKEHYEKVAYIGLRMGDSTLLNVPLYVRLSEVNASGLSHMQEDLMARISEVMIRRHEEQICAHLKKLKGGEKNA